MGLESDPDFWKMTLESDSPKRTPHAIVEGEAQITFQLSSCQNWMFLQVCNRGN